MHDSDDHGGALRAERPQVPDRAVDDHKRDTHRVIPLSRPDLVEHRRRDRARLPVLQVTSELRQHRLQLCAAQLLRHAEADTLAWHATRSLLNAAAAATPGVELQS